MLAEQGVDVDQQQAAVAQAWEGVLKEQQTSLEDSVARAAVNGVAAMLERLIGGMIVLRQGDPARGIDPDPTRGMDDAGVRELRGVVEDLRLAAALYGEVADRQEQQLEEAARRRAAGETLSSIAADLGITRKRLSTALRERADVATSEATS
jgi:DNA-binding phage protein